MTKFSVALLSGFGLLFLISCSKKSQQVNISSQEFMAGSFIQNGDTLNSKNGSNGRAVKGTLQAGQAYYLSSDFADCTVNSGDTLVVQSGVKVLVVGPSSGPAMIGTEGHAPALVINGTFFCLGTKTSPVLFSVADASLKSDPSKDPQDPNTDPAFKGYWGGIQGGAGSGDIIIKWTRLEYLGGIAPATAASRPGQARYGIFVTNPIANFVLEDCWLYGSSNDMVRPAGCKYEIFRKTFEKVGFTAGECVNVKSGSVGDIGYNLVVGGTGNAFKTANAGGLSPQSNMNTYNNTVITTGYRQAKAGEGGSIDFENGGRGMAYNNFIVDCAYGLSVLGGGGATPAADTANIRYGYTYNYGDDTVITDQFLPVGFITVAQPSDINGGNATKPGANNPSFVSYPLPLPASTNFNSADYVGSYNFHLNPASPATGKGNTGFAPYAVVKVDPVFGATEITPPGKDIGAFQTDGSGNQH
ncbi:MAG TPA: hypothetical protein VFE32_05770 [Puia sp.]|nr:hypothetical protein [Puia sp.]